MFALVSSVSFSMSQEAFLLTPEEMVFASKLSDQNRQKFCYQFSGQERSFAMKETLSPNESVEKILAFSENVLLSQQDDIK